MSKLFFLCGFISYSFFFLSQAFAEPYIPIFKKGLYVTKHGLECVFDKSFKADYGKVGHDSNLLINCNVLVQ